MSHRVLIPTPRNEGFSIGEAWATLSLIALAAVVWCSAVHAAPPETMPVWDAQIFLQTTDVSNAGTDDDVQVKLQQYGNETWIDAPGNDFERGQQKKYSLLLTNISTLVDINRLEINLSGGDGWCLRWASLWINGKPIFVWDFPAGKWLDTGHLTLAATKEQLRANSYWKSYVAPPSPTQFSAASIAQKVEAALGHMMHFNPKMYWGSGGVTVLDRAGVDKYNVAYYNLCVIRCKADNMALPLSEQNPQIDSYCKRMCGALPGQLPPIHDSPTCRGLKVMATMKNEVDNGFDHDVFMRFELDAFVAVANNRLGWQTHDWTVHECASEWGAMAFGIEKLVEFFSTPIETTMGMFTSVFTGKGLVYDTRTGAPPGGFGYYGGTVTSPIPASGVDVTRVGEQPYVSLRPVITYVPPPVRR